MEDGASKKEVKPLLLKLFKKSCSYPRAEDVTYQKIKSLIGDDLRKVQIETCFYVQFTSEDVDLETYSRLVWVLSTPFLENDVTRKSSFEQPGGNTCLIEIGPRLNFSTPFSTNTVSICKSVGITDVTRIEFSTRYLLTFTEDFQLDGEEEQKVVDSIHDKMTQCRYLTPVETFNLEVKPEDVYEIDVMGEGREALEKASEKQGLAFDNWDLDYYTELFREKIKRNPTNVECFDLAQSNSEHSRHWFFRGRLEVDGKEHPDSLFKMIMETQKHSNSNNVIKFSDNSSAIEGFETTVLVPSDPTAPSAMSELENIKRHVIFTAETHNFPTGVAPFPGATTGTGGRIRDVQSTGRGAHVVAGTAGYSFGNLKIPGYIQPWEDPSYVYPGNFASPLNIAIEASNGASDYGNKFGEPVLAGFARSFGMTDGGGERREYIKPIMFSGGIGQMEDIHVKKDVPQPGMLVTKVGGPVYRIGVGGGAASSVQVQGDNKEELDFGAVQRGDPEMEQKLNRVIRGCIERRERNPIASVHDQGAGGNGNVLKEIAEPAGALIQASKFQLGDPTLSVLELWGAEYQESNALLISPGDQGLVQKIADRERCPVNFVGTITGDGRVCCSNTKCNHINHVKTGKKHGRVWDVNTKFSAAIVHVGIGATQVNSLLSELNIPPVSHAMLDKRQKEIGRAVEDIAAESMSDALQKELEMMNEEMNENGLVVAVDAGWQKRGSGKTYDSLSGHCSMVGPLSDKVLSYSLRSKNCRVCSVAESTNKNPAAHECSKNWEGSSKAMEADMVIEMVQDLQKSKGITIDGIIGDEDSTTIARLKANVNADIKKLSDKNHLKKLFTNSLFTLKKKHSTLTLSVIKYIQKCFSYSIAQGKGNASQIKDLSSIPLHIFGDHQHCSSRWCNFINNPNLKYKSLPHGKPLKDRFLQDDLKEVFSSYASHSDRLSCLGSTQSNESFHRMVSAKAPKTHHYSSSSSLRYRVAACVAQKNVGHKYLVKIKLEGFKKETTEDISTPSKKRKKTINFPVDLDLEHVLGSMPRKVFKLQRITPSPSTLSLPENLRVRDSVERVLRLPSVASKRYLTNKVDRCVTGLVAQQQCVGPLHTPLADVGVTALSYLDKVGSCTAIGEQPIKGLISPACGARLSVAEALTNLVFAKVTGIKDIKCSGNWMWPAKLPGEGAALLEACSAMCDIMKHLGIAVDGGKDSLSMAARVGDQTVKAPGTLVISAYAACPDITLTVTPDLKCPDNKGCLLLVDLGGGNHRIGGSALAQCYKQLGDLCPDLDQPDVFCKAFNVTQKLIGERKISAGHDVSDGGLITAMMEMAFAGNCGIDVNLEFIQEEFSAIDVLFSEELGLILEVPFIESTTVLGEYAAQNVPCYLIGHSSKSGKDSLVNISIRGLEVIKEKMTVLRDIWEETSFQLEFLQANPKCVTQEQTGLKERLEPPYHVPFESEIISFSQRGRPTSQPLPKVAVLREEGSNSDREMAAVLHMAGFEVWDVNMEDLCSEQINLDQFRGLVFVGGFSYADVCGSAKGWAATALFNQSVREQLLKFKERPDTFSLGVCNGCQLMALLGWVAPDEDLKENSNSGVGQGLFLDHNLSERFECRFSSVRVMKSPAIMFRGMEDTVFGMWSAHGEGRMVFRSEGIYQDMCRDNLIAVKYVDDQGKPTEVYPLNPNGSRNGIAAICSEDGRHLAIMPHPERCFLPWQCAWMPQEMRKFDVSPWFKMFQNAFDWCRTQS